MTTSNQTRVAVQSPVDAYEQFWDCIEADAPAESMDSAKVEDDFGADDPRAAELGVCD